MSNEKKMTEQESLQLITEMIQKAKASHFHENGTSAILWGSVIGFCGLFSFCRAQFNWNTGWFDVWFLALIAIIPQIIINIKDSRKSVVKTDMQLAMNAIWSVYGFSIFALIFYFNVVPSVSERFLAVDNIILLAKDTQTGQISNWHPYIFSQGSLLMLLYAIPTLTTGIARKFKPMLIGGIICYIFFVASCFTTSKYDLLMNGLAGICNWLVPGLILRNRYLKQQGC
jgi:hypothetical protein